MATSSHSPLITTVVVATIAILITPSTATATTPPPFTRIFAFGDSFTDTGNTRSATGPSGFNYVSNPPYGMTFFHHPTNRYSDGRLVIDFVASSLALPFLPPYGHLNRSDEVASAGARWKSKSAPGSSKLTNNAGASGTNAPTPSTIAGASTTRKTDSNVGARNESGGVNFAVGGSTAIEHRFFVKKNLSFDMTPESLGTQLRWFEEYAKGKGCEKGWKQGSECMRFFENSLFWVGEIGANDYAYAAFGSVPQSVVQRLAIKRITSFLEVLLQKYAKYVVVQGLPPTGCLTLSMFLAPSVDRDNLGCVNASNQLSQSHNALLQAKLQSFRKQYPHTVILYADYWSSYASIIKNARKHGFTEPFKACCGSGGGDYNFAPFEACGSPTASACKDPSKYINWDGVHLTEAMYKVVADSFLHRNYTHPSFDYLLMRRKRQHV
ncbi:hypothetical protein Droror1_Dr00021389 [Drosera rotundifolia]